MSEIGVDSPTHTMSRDPYLLQFLCDSRLGVCSLDELIGFALSRAGHLGGRDRRDLALSLGALLTELSEKTGTGNDHGAAARYVSRIVDLVAIVAQRVLLLVKAEARHDLPVFLVGNIATDFHQFYEPRVSAARVREQKHIKPCDA